MFQDLVRMRHPLAGGRELGKAAVGDRADADQQRQGEHESARYLFSKRPGIDHVMFSSPSFITASIRMIARKAPAARTLPRVYRAAAPPSAPASPFCADAAGTRRCASKPSNANPTGRAPPASTIQRVLAARGS